MANDTETLADVSAWCRDIARSYRNASAIYNKIEIEGLKVCDYLDELANRIDAAAKREIPQPAGNAAAIRTALKRLRDASRDFYNQILNSQYSGILDKYTCTKQGFPAVLDVRAAIPAANAALSAPARNCDVGTAEEQDNRFTEVCTANSEDGVRGICSETCPFGLDHQSGCALAWAQMPYEAQEGGAA